MRLSLELPNEALKFGNSVLEMRCLILVRAPIRKQSRQRRKLGKATVYVLLVDIINFINTNATL